MDFLKNEDAGNTGTLKKCFLTNTESYFWKLGEKTSLIIPCRGTALYAGRRDWQAPKCPDKATGPGRGQGAEAEEGKGDRECGARGASLVPHRPAPTVTSDANVQCNPFFSCTYPPTPACAPQPALKTPLSLRGGR